MKGISVIRLPYHGLRRLVASLSLRTTTIDTRLVHVEFMVNKVAWAQSFLRGLWSYSSVLFH